MAFLTINQPRVLSIKHVTDISGGKACDKRDSFIEGKWSWGGHNGLYYPVSYAFLE